MQLFVTGTDTAVGKTEFCCWLVRQWRARGHDAIGVKPLATGSHEDAERLAEASGGLPRAEVEHSFFTMPASPWRAALAEGKEVDFHGTFEWVLAKSRAHRCLVVEGVGGWRVPLTADKSLSDLAVLFHMPIVIVARAGLGTINHTRLTLDAINREVLAECTGIVLNYHGADAAKDPSLYDNETALRELTGLPVLAFGDTTRSEPVLLPDWLTPRAE